MFKDIGKNIGYFIDKHPTFSAVATGIGFFGTAVSNQAINQAWNAYSITHNYENHLMFDNPNINETLSHNHTNTHFSPATWEGLGWNLLANGMLPITSTFLLLVYKCTENYCRKNSEDENLINSEHKRDSGLYS